MDLEKTGGKPEQVELVKLGVEESSEAGSDGNGNSGESGKDENSVKSWGLQEVFVEVSKVLPGLSKLCNIEFLPTGTKEGESNMTFDAQPKDQPPRTDKDMDLPLSANWQAVYFFAFSLLLFLSSLLFFKHFF